MRAIFISYRRDDAEGEAGRLFSDLSKHFGEDRVFMDVVAIEPGRDFRKVIDQNVASCGVLLAMIGTFGNVCWALAGHLFQRLFRQYGRQLNIVLALLLVYCAVRIFY